MFHAIRRIVDLSAPGDFNAPLSRSRPLVCLGEDEGVRYDVATVSC